MASITIRSLGDDLKARLRVRAARRGRSMEEEAREILRGALSRCQPAPTNLAQAIRDRFAGIDGSGVELEIPSRDTSDPPLL